MKTALVELERITPYDRNPRNADAAVDAVANSIRQFGFRQPIVVDAQFVIIAGHARYFAAIRLGLEKVPVHVAKELSPEQVRAYRLADNKTAELAGWDDDLLAKEILALTDAELDLSELGFAQEFLDSLTTTVAKEISNDPKSGARQLSLKFGKFTVPLDQVEFDALAARVTEYETETGSRFGFVAHLLDIELPLPSPKPSQETPSDVSPELSPAGTETSIV